MSFFFRGGTRNLLALVETLSKSLDPCVVYLLISTSAQALGLYYKFFLMSFLIYTFRTPHLYMQISMYKMQRSVKQEIVRNKKCDHVALLMDPDADHATVVAKAAAAFSLNPDGCSLVRLSGGKLLNVAVATAGH